MKTKKNSLAWKYKVLALVAGLSTLAFSPVTTAEDLTLTYLSGAPVRHLLDGRAETARFNDPSGLAIDSAGNIYVAETGSHVIRRITPEGSVSTLAGRAGEPGTADGPPGQGRLTSPQYIAVDPNGNVYVSDETNRTIRKVTPGGVVSTLAGLVGAAGKTDGTGGDARFNQPTGVAWANGSLYVADQTGSRIRRISVAGVVSTLPLHLFNCELVAAAPDGTVFYMEVGKNSARLSRLNADGTASAMPFESSPIISGIAADSNGNVFVVNSHEFNLYRVTQTSRSRVFGWDSRQWRDGTGPEAGIADRPAGMAVDALGNVLVADRATHTIRRISPDGVISTVAGYLAAPAAIYDSWPWRPQLVEGPATEARFGASGLAVDAHGRLAVADLDLVFTVASDGFVSLLAGKRGAGWEGDGTGTEAMFRDVEGIAADGLGNLYVTEVAGRTVRKISPGAVVTTLAGKFGGASGSADGVGSAARFTLPRGIASTREGTLFVADNAHTIRKITPDATVTTLAGVSGRPDSVDGFGSEARFSDPTAVALSPSGYLYVADSTGRTIRKVSQSGWVTTFAGTWAETGDADGPADEARFTSISSMTVHPSGDLYVADAGALRRITPDGVVITIKTQIPVARVCSSMNGDLFAYASGTLFRVPRPVEDRAWVDAQFGPVGIPRQLDAPPATAATWEWTLVQRPPGSRASLSTTERSPVFVPDAPGLFVFELSASEGTRRHVSQTSVIAGPEAPTSLLLSSGRVSVTLDWKNPYDGRSGRAHATPGGGQHGFFWYDDPDNPEILVKVLDFGLAEPFLLFWSGLTDFEYTIRFTNLETGATYEAHHPARNLDGGLARLPRAPTSRRAPASISPLPVEEAVEMGPRGVVLAGDISVSVAWRSQYNESSGRGSANASGESFGLFSFFKPENPEVSVKVLDWGPDRPYLLFWTGLTDFEYSVTFRNLRTGQAATFVKEAGRVGGGIDTQTLLH